MGCSLAPYRDVKNLKHKWIDVATDEDKTSLGAAWKQQTLILNAVQLKAVEKQRTELSKLLKLLPECPHKQHVETRLRALQLSLCSVEAQAVREVELLLKVKAMARKGKDNWTPEQEEQLQRARDLLSVYDPDPPKTLFQKFIETIKNLTKRKVRV